MSLSTTDKSWYEYAPCVNTSSSHLVTCQDFGKGTSMKYFFK